MDIKELKNKILEDTENIRKILEYIGCCMITKHTSEYRCAKNQEDANPTRVCVKINENLTSRIYELFTVKGDILTLIMELKKCKLSNAMKICCIAIGIEYDNKITSTKKQRKKAFGGFYSSLHKEKINFIEIKIYDDTILNQYINQGNLRFKQDGIEYDIQTEFDIMYDVETKRILVPWRDIYGNIVGIMGRFNASAEYCTLNGISKWLPLTNLNFPKSYFLYGLYQNYKYILQEGRVYVGESEKFVLQTASFGVRNTVAIGSHDISEHQRKLLLSLGVDIVTCMDEDITDEFNAEQCKSLKSASTLIGGKVGFAMVDGILKSKESPTDRGIEVFNKCIDDENIFWM
jgi:hypothetical protein